jgi:5-methylthioadenosine/S-adenosylhomocysteine deaminase
MRYHARWVLPITQPPIENGTVVESDGVITYVGRRSGAPPGGDYDLGDAILLPGLINTHTHLELTAMRGFLENCRFTEWIDKLRQSRNEVMSDEMLLDSARFGVMEGLVAGITTYADTCSSGVAMRAMNELGVRGIMYQEVFGPDPSHADEAMRELTGRDALYRAAAEFASSRRLPMAMHIAESEEEYEFVANGRGDFAEGWKRRGIAVTRRARSPIELLDQLGALDRGPLLIHCVRVDDADMEIIALRRCAVAHCPASNAKFGHGIAPLLPLLSAGIRVGIGSDSVASNNRMDILDEARLAVLIHRAATRRHDAFGAHQALELATIGGARALGIESRVGSLEPGKDADLAAFRTDIARTTPLGDPYSTAIFALPGRSAELVTVRGRVLVERGRARSGDVALAQRVREVGTALASWVPR